jgi:cell division protein FtsI (penicillin-binding protein 3)
MIARRRIGRRLVVAMVAVFALLAVFIVRLVDIQVVQAEALTKAAQARQEFQTTVYGTRGEIVDTNGVVLAASVDRFDITASPRVAKIDGYGFDRKLKDGTKKAVSLEDSVSEIAAITGADPQKMYQAIIGDPTSDFTYLVKKVPLAQYQKVKALHIPWVFAQLHPARSYPNGAVAANLIGIMGTDKAQAGVELSENSCLAGSNGTQSYHASANGVPIPGSTITTKPAVDGGRITLTIDSDLQWFAQQTLTQQVHATGAQWGTAMVVRIRDGHIMADADYGSGDLNDITDAKQLLARSFVSPYEPGSVMKPATVAGLLQSGKITASTPVNVPSRFTDGLPPGVSITDSFYHGDLHLTASGVIMDSSNIGIAELTKLDSEANRYANLAKFGFGQKTAAGFYGEDPGVLKTPAQADVVTSITQQFGQGMTATSAQVAQLYQTLGNDGVRMPLTLVEGCTKPDGTVVDKPSTQGTQVVSAATARTVRDMMQTVYQEGPSSSFLKIPGYNIAAKTGTAQVADPRTGKYAKGQYIVSVAGLVPADKPLYAVVFTLAKPQGITSSVAATPGWKTIMGQVIKAYRVPASKGAPSLPPVTW